MENRVGTLLFILIRWKIYTTNSKSNYLFILIFPRNGIKKDLKKKKKA